MTWGTASWSTTPWSAAPLADDGEEDIVEVATASDDVIATVIANVLELAYGRDVVASKEAFHVSSASLGYATDVPLVFFQMLVSDTGHAHDAVATTYQLISFVVDAAIAAGVVSNVLAAKNAVVEAAVARDAVNRDWPVSAIDTGAAHDVAAHLLEFNVALVEHALAQATPSFTASVVIAVTEVADATDAAATKQAAHEFVLDGAKAVVTFALNGDVFTGVVLHPRPDPREGHAVTEYTQFPFNSFMYFNGTYYGVADNGIYALAGDDDAGTPIAARVRTGLLRIADGLVARVPVAYFGIATSGDMILKVITTSKLGAKQENWYKLEPRTADTMRETRVKPAKGLKSVYWGFELANVDGAFFTNDEIQFFPLALERRVR